MMRIMWICFLALIMLVVASACVPPRQPISGESAGIQNYLGLFTIMPPQGDNWYEVQRQAGVLAYGKKLESSRHTFIASVHVTRTDKNFPTENDFLSFVRTARANDSNPERFKMIVNDEALDRTKSAFCTKFHQKVEDKSASSILESKGFTCLHPKQPLVVTIQYSERSSEPFNNETLIREGEGFINSLQLK